MPRKYRIRLNKCGITGGRKTWESIPDQFRPLTGRLNVVLSRSGSFDIATAENVVMCGSLGSALEMLAAPPYSMSIETVFLIGGGKIYREALSTPNCDAIHITEIENAFECDSFITPIDASVFRPWYSSLPIVESDIRYSFTTYVRIRNSSNVDSQEPSHRFGNGSNNMDIYGRLEFRHYHFLPKLIFERHEEYLHLKDWYRILFQMEWGRETGHELANCQNLAVRCGSICEKLYHFSQQSIGLKEREEADLGPVYGFQWRHFGARLVQHFLRLIIGYLGL